MHSFYFSINRLFAMPNFGFHRALLLLLPLTLLSCGGPGQNSQLPQVSASTTFIGDLVTRIGGPDVDLQVLLPRESDPHAYQPTPGEMARLHQSRLLLLNGLGLESFLEPILSGLPVEQRRIELSEGLAVPELGEDHKSGTHEDEHSHHTETVHHDEHMHHNHSGDPHAWLDPLAVHHWNTRICEELQRLVPDKAEEIGTRASAMGDSLLALDAWIRERVSHIPPARRLLVGDHMVFGWFARRYGFTQVGSMIQGFSSLSSPNARDLAALEVQLRAEHIPAVFLSRQANPALGRQLHEDTGITIVPLSLGSLEKKGSTGDNYLGFMRNAVNAICEALK